MARWNDPTRPVTLAVMGCRVLGIFGLLPGTGLVALVCLRGASPPAFLAATVIACGGVAHLAVAQRLNAGSRQAAVCGIVVTALTMLGVGCVMAFEWLVLAIVGDPHVMAAFRAVFAAEALLLIGLVWLIVQLGRSFSIIRRMSAAAVHGFEVLPVPVVPTDPAGGVTEIA